MKKALTTLALAMAAAAASMSAQAGVLRTTINFEAPIDASPFLSYPGSNLLGSGDEFYQAGLAGRTMYFSPFSNSASAVAGDLVGFMGNGSDASTCWSITCPSNNPSTYLGLLDDAVMVMGSTDGFRFSVKNFKASFISNGDPIAAIPGYVRLQGIRNGASTIATFALTGLDANGALNFGTINTGTFGNIEFDYVYAYGFACPTPGVAGSCSAFSTDRAQFALDDITIEHVPEPASLALVSLAGLAAAGARRRRAA
ncbi:NF038120 family PEP-CTERM protein [Roseateles sp. BYS87W]|uniref:NF038120 family PEP-CTERM protein n=1 Tax=Pelomonas baiyunensis TaxID=3299026 RepID=A0ABW7H1I8_9BURK